MTTLPTHFFPPFLPAISTVHQAPFSDSIMIIVIMIMIIILLIIILIMVIILIMIALILEIPNSILFICNNCSHIT